ncbi:Biopolymer transport protein ExbD/TolR [Stieleria bergensis]|uniref:Biopolymer transport protein ExbD/TolR n=1 Tax=Stieleria bergensis TaxID=2528025 RepID=A0A517SVG0_9BACT|nr:Biopolymer transport protein ExbD/TolR [Planctomycetes bacterium SV_7m_r]
MRTPTRSNSRSLEVKMTPMIDVVFLLLIFFVWTSSFEDPEYDLPSAFAEKPQQTGSRSTSSEVPVDPFDEIIIRLTVSEDHLQVQMGEEPVLGLASLQERVAAIMSIGVQPPIVIDPDGDVSMKDAVKVYDTVRAAGADRVLYATEGPG